MRILILSQHIFPMQTPRAHRTTELMKEFARQGHDVTVYAVLGKYDYSEFLKQFPSITLKNIPLKWMYHPYNSDGDGKRYFIDKALGKLLGKRYLFPNFEFYHRVQGILKKDYEYDAVISIADPHQIHWGVACYRKYNPNQFPKTWIADCGDPFMNNDTTYIYPKKFAKYEHLFCQQADFITVPEPEAANGYYEEYRSKIKIIPQGFYFDENRVKVEPNNSIPIFGYAGTFYEDIRNPRKFMELLCSIDRPFKFIVYSNHTALIDSYKEKLKGNLEIRKGIPRDELLLELEKMDFLVNLANVNRPNQIPSKLIDYAITGRPILSINPLISSTDIIIEFLNRDYSNQHVVNDIENYQISNVTRQFIELINEKHK
jgi:hypothetical protein